KGAIENGKVIFQAQCAICHVVGAEGKDFGPALTQIGSKLPKTALLAAIKNPSAGINFGYETATVTLKKGGVLSGIISSRTESEVTLRFIGGASQTLKTADIATI